MEKDRGAALRWIKADGGLTHSNISMRMIAGLLGTEVRIDKRHEASALGAALLALIGKGSLNFPEVEELARNSAHESYLPGPKLDKELESSYNQWLKRVKLPT
jgi:glycerol kinase